MWTTFSLQIILAWYLDSHSIPMTMSKLPILISMRSILKGWLNKIRVQPRITVLVPTRFPSAISMSSIVSNAIGGILSMEARDMDTKLLSAPKSNNTLFAQCVQEETHLRKGVMASGTERSLDGSSEGLHSVSKSKEVFPGVAGE
nr:hypothetical protein [Tanacetum cinerariifolium]